MLALSPISFTSKFQNSITFNLGLRCYYKKLKKKIYIYIYIVVLRNLVPMGLIPSTLCKAHHTYGTHTQNALDDPTRSSGAPGYGIQPVLALTWYNQIFK